MRQTGAKKRTQVTDEMAHAGAIMLFRLLGFCDESSYQFSEVARLVFEEMEKKSVTLVDQEEK